MCSVTSRFTLFPSVDPLQEQNKRIKRDQHHREEMEGAREKGEGGVDSRWEGKVSIGF